MQARLFCKTGQLAGATFAIGEQATIGTRAENEIVLYPKIVSGRHARISFDKAQDSYFLEDLASKNGTALDGIEISGRVRLGSLHVVTVAGEFDFIFQRIQRRENQEADEADPASAKTVPLEPEPKVAGAARAAVTEKPKPPEGHKDVPPASPAAEPSAKPFTTPFGLEVALPAGGRKMIPLVPGENSVGRSSACQICLDHHSVSRQHAILLAHPDGVVLIDLGSKNRTKVNEKRISGRIELHAGMLICFGAVETRLVLQPGRKAPAGESDNR